MVLPLDQFVLIRASLLPNERIEVEEPWSLQSLSDYEFTLVPPPDIHTLDFRISIDSLECHVDVRCTEESTKAVVGGRSISRERQAAYREELEARLNVPNDEVPLYDTVSLYLLPSLQVPLPQRTTPPPSSSSPLDPGPPSPYPVPHHALFTSHHLLSAKKRRSLQSWSSELGLRGFCKIGYPGVIYAQACGSEDIDEFVRLVKGMKWLALKLRFCEPMNVPNLDLDGRVNGTNLEKDSILPFSGEVRLESEWAEVEKVGEVVVQMKKRGVEALAHEMGIGTAS